MTDAGDIERMNRIIKRIRSRGVVVREITGWQQRGATWARVPVGIIDHHDASTRKSGEWGALGIITTGRKGIPGPLSQFQRARCLDDVPKVAVVAAGRANHAGKGGPERFGPDLVPLNAGNSHVYGMEVAHDGLREPITEAAHFASDVTLWAVLEELTPRTFHVGRVRGHKEWTPRKIDPVYDMSWRRDRIAALRTPPKPPAPPKPEGPPMSAAQYASAAADAILSRVLIKGTPNVGRMIVDSYRGTLANGAAIRALAQSVPRDTASKVEKILDDAERERNAG